MGTVVQVRSWLMLSRPPFHTVGVFPFLLGAFLAWAQSDSLNLPVLLWGLLAVVFIMLATYLAGEYWDYEVDQLSAQLERNIFSAGTQVLQAGVIARRHALIASLVSLVCAGGAGLLLQFYYRTGPYTIPLGALGMFAGYFYSTKPIQWAYRGVGELWIAFCYGWLAVAASYYLQTGRIDPLVHWMSPPIALTIFNVILINQFPDYPADLRLGKKNLVVRLGRERASWLYTLANVALWLSYPLAISAGTPSQALFLMSPVLAISLLATLQVLGKGYQERRRLERLCAMTLVVNLGTTISFIGGVLW